MLCETYNLDSATCTFAKKINEYKPLDEPQSQFKHDQDFNQSLSKITESPVSIK